MKVRRPFPLRSLLLALSLTCFVALPSTAAVGAYERAQQQWMQGRHADAIQTLEKALDEDPNNPRLRFSLALMRMESGDGARAEQMLRAMTEDFPDLADPFNNLAVILAERGELDAAFVALQRAVALQPEHVQAQENLGDVLLQLAARAYAQANKPGPNQSSSAGLKLRQTRELIQSLSSAPR